MMKQIKKICLWSLIILFTILIIYNLYNMINIKILKKNMTSIFGYSLLEVMSSSMEPTILKEDFIIINQHDKEYKKGDIITFYDKNNMLVTHRIVKVEHDHVITQGDHNKTRDGLLSKKKIVGKYVFRIPGAGKVVSLLKNPLVIMIVIILIILVCAMEVEKEEYQEFLKYKNEKRKIREEQAYLSAGQHKKGRKNNHKKKKKRAKRKQRRG